MGNVFLEYAEEYGKEKGIAEGKDIIAKNMLAKGYDVLEILELTGIVPARLRELINSVSAPA